MQIDYNILPEISLYVILFFGVYFICYRKFIYSILDPLFIYSFTLSFSSVLVIYTLADQPSYLFHFFACHTFFFVGFLTGFRLFNEIKQPIITVPLPTIFFDYKTLQMVIYLLFTFYVLVNVILLYTVGFALLSDNPTTAKVENFTQGFGIVLKINWGIGGFLIAGLLFLILSETRRIDLVLLSVVTVFTALEGSKSSLLRILITLILLVNHPIFKQDQRIIKKIRLSAPLGVVAMLSVFFTVLFKENVDSEQAVFALIRRLLYGADSTLYFYMPVNEQYFARFHFWEYPSHFLNQILGFLRIVPYNEAFGNVMVANAVPSMTGTIIGPNTPYYIEGQIFFGYYGAFIYSAIIGGCYALVRQYFFGARYYSAFWLVLICCLCQQANALTVEVTLFIAQAFNTCLFVVPVYVITSLAMRGKLQFRKLHI